MVAHSGEVVDLSEFSALLVGLGATIEAAATGSHDDSDVLIGEVVLDVPDDATFELWRLGDPEPSTVTADDVSGLLATAIRALIVEGVRFEADDENGES